MSSTSRLTPLWRRTSRCCVVSAASSSSSPSSQPAASRAARFHTTQTPRTAPSAPAHSAQAPSFPRLASGRRWLHHAASTTTGPPSGEPLVPPPAMPAPLPAEDDSGGAAAAPAHRHVLRQLELLSQGLDPFDVETDGHRFGLTTATTRAVDAAEAEAAAVAAGQEDTDLLRAGVPLPLTRKVRDRYDPVISQLTRLLMRDGKLAKAQRDMAMILNYLRTSPPPKLSPARPLMPGCPPSAELPTDPERYLAIVIDSVSPLIKIRQYADLAGGGRALPVPLPLTARQRRRTAFMWLMELVNKKPSRGSGRGMLAQRVGDEIIAVAEGRSGLWDRRDLLHKQATSARANIRMVKK